MKNLLERMKPEPLAKFNEAKKKYPVLLEITEKDLRNNYNIFGLKYDTITDLKMHKISPSCESGDIYDLFND